MKTLNIKELFAEVLEFLQNKYSKDTTKSNRDKYNYYPIKFIVDMNYKYAVGTKILMYSKDDNSWSDLVIYEMLLTGQLLIDSECEIMKRSTSNRLTQDAISDLGLQKAYTFITITSSGTTFGIITEKGIDRWIEKMQIYYNTEMHPAIAVTAI
jgi:hypothetical protein